ncbi:MAG: hypothetical protein A2571_03185 [Candidatus Vogelbacteria bacterium RIFOXYD1_FULL_44_32]|uniref:HNH nuclease domain-containing protein n=1 Tax=Candidatus Vogelbacteria bacterium RIFOXYD1_FULL_44_32 TaxID=1802438 RepID=A0A1G2QCD9_9BACT|nr:MAG: hypothetical protein A2571_03185 [Candidatus Vogelbacteria bacterium RIFOXYD1_FULL_44_32]
MIIKEEGIIKDGKIIVQIGKGLGARSLEFCFTDFFSSISFLKEQEKTPVKSDGLRAGSWFFKSKMYIVSGQTPYSDEEIKLRIKHFVIKKEKELTKISKEVEAFENFDQARSARRGRIPDDVRLFVWQRDEGKCIKCGTKEKLEFDHIIPVVAGGANTQRNIQLLCELCNRTKGKNI